MKKLLPLVLLPLLAFVGPPEPGVVMEILSKDLESGETWVSTTYAVGGDLLMEFSDPRDGTSGSMVFLAADGGQMIMNDDQAKTYTRMDQATLAQVAERMAGVMKQLEEMMADMPEAQREMIKNAGGGMLPGLGGSAPVVEMSQTDDTDVRQGYDVRRHEMRVNGRVTQEMWIADWEDVEGASNLRGAFLGFSDMMSAFLEAIPTGMFGEGGMGDVMDFDRGVPVVTYEFDDEGNRETESVLQSISEADIDRSTFGPKAGYSEQKMELPGMN